MALAYAECQSEVLTRMPTGAQIVYSASGGSLGDGIAFYSGRGYFAAANGSVEYFDLPAQ